MATAEHSTGSVRGAPASHPAPYPGFPLELEWVREARVNRSAVERLSACNLKRTWIGEPGRARAPGTEQALLRHATQVKHIWVPNGA